MMFFSVSYGMASELSCSYDIFCEIRTSTADFIRCFHGGFGSHGRRMICGLSATDISVHIELLALFGLDRTKWGL